MIKLRLEILPKEPNSIEAYLYGVKARAHYFTQDTKARIAFAAWQTKNGKKEMAFKIYTTSSYWTEVYESVLADYLITKEAKTFILDHMKRMQSDSASSEKVFFIPNEWSEACGRFLLSVLQPLYELEKKLRGESTSLAESLHSCLETYMALISRTMTLVDYENDTLMKQKVSIDTLDEHYVAFRESLAKSFKDCALDHMDFNASYTSAFLDPRVYWHIQLCSKSLKVPWEMRSLVEKIRKFNVEDYICFDMEHIYRSKNSVTQSNNTSPFDHGEEETEGDDDFWTSLERELTSNPVMALMRKEMEAYKRERDMNPLPALEFWKAHSKAFPHVYECFVQDRGMRQGTPSFKSAQAVNHVCLKVPLQGRGIFISLNLSLLIKDTEIGIEDIRRWAEEFVDTDML